MRAENSEEETQIGEGIGIELETIIEAKSLLCYV
jgi:hypothetical protein